jgi:SacI restriction endonuclease
VSKRSLEVSARELLDSEWQRSATAESSALSDREIGECIDSLVDARTKSYRYAVIVQLLAKATDPSLHAASLQKQASLRGAFDARSLCDEVVVPFDRRNDAVLGGSSEPYANNPLRIPAILPKYRKQQRQKTEFDQLCRVVDFAQNNPSAARDLLAHALGAVRRRLESTRVIYPVPIRTSLDKTLELVAAFLDERTGGARLEALMLALFRTLGERFGAFSQVTCQHVNSADASTGMIADIECTDAASTLVLAVEVKDRQLTLKHTQDKLPAARQRGLKELLFLVTGGVQSDDAPAIAALIKREFEAGQNIYVFEHLDFTRFVAMLLGEVGRRHFLVAVGNCLDQQRAAVEDRRRWRDLLADA